MPTRDQQYATLAFEKVNAFQTATTDEAKQKKYGSMAHKLPVLIRTAGLSQSLAFLDARGSEEQQQLLQHLAETIGATNSATLLSRVRAAELGEYMRLTHDAQTALLWFKRFAQSVLKVESGEQDKGGD
jgi:CRISPR-associated protein Cmr5